MLNSFLFPKRKEKIVTVAFYNVENLFDTKDNPKTYDDDFTTDGTKNWNEKRYAIKIKKLGSVISQLGVKRSKMPPVIVGLVEVENAKVVNDLKNSSHLKKYPYHFVHYDSPDDRGIDVALMYNRQFFELIDSKSYPLFIETSEGKQDFTRDILRVSGNLNGELIHVLVNHWPSRREGAEASEYKRIAAAELAKSIVNEIQTVDVNAKIIVMGDFNDDPTSKSIQEHLVTEDFYNPMEPLLNREKTGTLTYNGKWNLFDQIILTKNFKVKEPGKHTFKHAEVFNKEWLKIFKGKLKGSPFRTYIGKWYQGGFSDHFPVYAYFKKED